MTWASTLARNVFKLRTTMPATLSAPPANTALTVLINFYRNFMMRTPPRRRRAHGTPPLA